MRETRNMQDETRRTREELDQAHERAQKAEARISELQEQLEQASHMMRHDQLTGALNRRGLEETFERESARALRRNAPICVALLDIDNFKRLNDTFGHRTGDEALIHLIRVIRENLRPSDTVARLGGEEFIILYPEADLDQACAALVRLQRALTKRFFLAEDRKLLITFSAGVSPWLPGEGMDSVINRADEAMYEAKKTGKNKVIPAPAPVA
jgi:diguanylate cyclase